MTTNPYQAHELLYLKPHEIDDDLYEFCRRDKRLPFFVRAKIINLYRKGNYRD